MKTREFKKAINSLPTLKEKQLFYLNDVVSHYTSLNRCVKDGTCKYEPIKGKSGGCAIGRRLPIKLATELDNSDTSTSGTGVCTTSIFLALPEWIKELGKDFLSDIQGLHDDINGENWDLFGLTRDGENAVKGIKKSYKLD